MNCLSARPSGAAGGGKSFNLAGEQPKLRREDLQVRVEQPDPQFWSRKMGDGHVGNIIDQQILIGQGHVLAPFSGEAWRLPDVDDGAVDQFNGAKLKRLSSRTRLGELKSGRFKGFV